MKFDLMISLAEHMKSHLINPNQGPAEGYRPVGAIMAPPI